MKINNFAKTAAMLSLFSATLISCNKETKSEPSTVGVVPPTTNPAFQNLDGAPQQAATTTTAPAPVNGSAAPAATTTAPGMNPPHGQPGHRCEIAVGAPLNSQPAAKPATTQPQPQQMAPPQMKPAATAKPSTPVVTAPGMNPPHGQPGHTCSVAVGAPLPK